MQVTMIASFKRHYYHEEPSRPIATKLAISRAKAQSVVISTEGRNLSQISRPPGMTDLGSSLGAPFDSAQDMLCGFAYLQVLDP